MKKRKMLTMQEQMNLSVEYAMFNQNNITCYWGNREELPAKQRQVLILILRMETCSLLDIQQTRKHGIMVRNRCYLPVIILEIL